MYRIHKTLEVAGAHHLKMKNPDHKCCRPHGHNWVITVSCQAERLNEEGMVVDFGEIKEVVMAMDHSDLNEFMGSESPTAEKMARWIHSKIDSCYKVVVQESLGNVAEYEEDRFNVRH